MQLEKLRQQLSNTINESNLPIDCIYYVLKDVYGEIVSLYNRYLAQARQEEEEDRSE